MCHNGNHWWYQVRRSSQWDNIWDNIKSEVISAIMAIADGMGSNDHATEIIYDGIVNITIAFLHISWGGYIRCSSTKTANLILPHKLQHTHVAFLIFYRIQILYYNLYGRDTNESSLLNKVQKQTSELEIGDVRQNTNTYIGVGARGVLSKKIHTLAYALGGC